MERNELGMPRDPREVVITGVGVCCHMGDDLPSITHDLQQGKNKPFDIYEPAVESGARCNLIGLYPNELDPSDLGVGKLRT